MVSQDTIIESEMKAAVIVAGLGVISGWLILRYALESSTRMQPVWTTDTALLVFLGFALFAAFIYAMIKLTGRKY